MARTISWYSTTFLMLVGCLSSPVRSQENNKQEAVAKIIVKLPPGGEQTRLKLDGLPTKQTGLNRTFETAPFVKDFDFTIGLALSGLPVKVTRYRPVSKTITLPDGRTVKTTPIEAFDVTEIQNLNYKIPLRAGETTIIDFTQKEPTKQVGGRKPEPLKQP